MEPERARAIIRIAQEHGFEANDPPEKDSEAISLAEMWIEEAEKSQKEGMKHPAIVAILNLAEQGNTAVADEGREEPDPVLAMESTYPRRSSGGLSESDEREAVHALENLMKLDRLPTPPEIEDDPEPMPVDLSVVADKKIRYLASFFNAYLNRARWKHALATSDLANAQHLRDAEYRKAYKRLHEEISKKGDRPTRDLIDSLAQEDPRVVSMNHEVSILQSHVTAYKALMDIYSSNVERLSRESTIRHHEWERSR